jgi:hypothetical protein
MLKLILDWVAGSLFILHVGVLRANGCQRLIAAQARAGLQWSRAYGAKGGKRDVHEMVAMALTCEALIDSHGSDLNAVQTEFIESFAQTAVGYFKQAATRAAADAV